MKYFLILTVACLANSVFASDISGTVTLSNGKSAPLAVVFLEGGAKKVTPLTHAVIDQRGKKFLPHVLAVPVGSTVEFPNNDTVFHNVFAEYNAKRFDLGMYPKGSTRKQTFPKPGLVAIFCSVHSDMSAFIVVVDTPYYKVADKTGHFYIKDVPSGHYTLKVWQESGEILQKPMIIGQSDQTLELHTKRS